VVAFGSISVWVDYVSGKGGWIVEVNDPQPFDLWRFLKKTRIELVVFLFLVALSGLLMPKEALMGLSSLLAAKVLTLTVGVTLAHLMRIFGFPYLSLSEMLRDGQWSGVIFLAMWYSVIIYAVAVGG
jgi:hypothetical protein